MYRRLRTVERIVLLVLLSLAVSACAANSPSMMNPAGPASRSIAQLSWLFFILGGLIFLMVMAYLVYALRRPRSQPGHEGGGTRVVIFGGMVLPAGVLLVIFVLNTHVLGQVSAPDESRAKVLIEVTGRQWWWQLNYPDLRIRTANEIHIPVGEPVLLKLRSEDVIHSFWVPELHGKMDLIPGRVNDFWIQADKPGVYRGECAEYCGKQHAKMQFLVIAQSQQEFRDWAAQMQQPLNPSSSAVAQTGLRVFLASSCVQCHTIQGTEATGVLGPDLTHVGSRRTIGAGTLPLTRANLGGWIANPQGVKPGVNMPPSNLSAEDLNTLIDFLMVLQ